MFGREPRLPIDFLLGRVQDPVPGKVQDWVAEHQARLRVAFEGAHDRLLAAAGRRKERHDQHVHDKPLRVGQLVYLRDHSARGRHKISDLWSSVVYQVLRAPRGEGAVYTIAPVADLEKVRNVHRNMLKAKVGPDLAGPPLASPPTPPLQSAALELPSCSDDDLWVLVPETSLPSAVPVAGSAGPMGPPAAARPREAPVPGTPLAQEGALVFGSSPPPVGAIGVSQPAVRRTGRSTAGQHSNVHHLPRSAGCPDGEVAGPSRAVSNVQSAFHRPWC